MNYCSIEDAWGKNDYITDQYKNYEGFTNNDEINYTINDNKIPKKIIKNQNIQKCFFTCDDLIDHLNKCQKCRMKIKQMFSFKIIDKVKHIIFHNKDSILLFLIVLFILIFCKLLYSLI